MSPGPAQAEPFQIRLTLERRDFALKVDIALPAQGISVLFGPSGSGKTTLLRCVAGLERAQGVLALGHEIWQDSQRLVFVPTWRRALGYVFQESSLFPHLNVRQNLRYGLHRAARADALERELEAELEASLELLGLRPLLERPVAHLSGGERQRVAIARALATRPRLLLLDEPLAALDGARRKEVLPWLERLHSQLRTPMLYVTHSADELARLADHVLMLEQGSVRASGPVTQALACQELALALGEEAGVVASGLVTQRHAQEHMVQIQFGGLSLWARDQGVQVGQYVRVRILARDVSLALSEHEDSTILNRCPGHLVSLQADAHPSQALVRVQCGQTTLLARVTQHSLRKLGLGPGSKVWCQVKSVALIV